MKPKSNLTELKCCASTVFWQNPRFYGCLMVVWNHACIPWLFCKVLSFVWKILHAMGTSLSTVYQQNHCKIFNLHDLSFTGFIHHCLKFRGFCIRENHQIWLSFTVLGCSWFSYRLKNRWHLKYVTEYFEVVIPTMLEKIKFLLFPLFRLEVLS